MLCEAPEPTAFAEMAHAAGAELGPFTDAYWQLRGAYDRGELGGPAYWLLVGERVGAHIGAELTAELVEHDIALWSRVDDRMLGWANALADAGVRVGLLSNMVAEIGEHLRDTMRLFDRFASVTYSYEVRLAKPDPRIYHHALASLGAVPHEALLVDDRAPNIESARAMGMHAHHFRGHADLVAEIASSYSFGA